MKQFKHFLIFQFSWSDIKNIYLLLNQVYSSKFLYK